MLLKIKDLQIDSIKINFNTEGLWLLNIAIAIIMFGVALGITIDDFKRLLKKPKIVVVGVFSQFISVYFLNLHQCIFTIYISVFSLFTSVYFHNIHQCIFTIYISVFSQFTSVYFHNLLQCIFNFFSFHNPKG